MIKLKTLILKEQGAAGTLKVIDNSIEAVIDKVGKSNRVTYPNLEKVELELVGDKPQFKISWGRGKYNGKLLVIAAPTEDKLKQKVKYKLQHFKTEGYELLNKLNDNNFKSAQDDVIIDADGNPMPIFWQAFVIGPRGIRGKVKNTDSNSFWGEV
tara:strand:+ start:702 stop:1166 length:465 start_codon:yes stop_codon:yes gene_type:complete